MRASWLLPLLIPVLFASPARAEDAFATDKAEIVATGENALKNAKSDAEKALVEADLAFAAHARQVGVAEAFSSRFLPDGKLIPPSAPILVGPEAVRQAMAGDRNEWWWAPAEAIAGGELGVTRGLAAIIFKDAQGVQHVARTRYVTVWKKEPSGEWKIWLDTGNSAP